MEGQFRCGKKVTWIYKKLAQAIFSSIIQAILIEFMILKFISKIHLIHLFIALSSFYFYSHGQEFFDHGLFNLLGQIIIVIATLIMLLPFNILLYLIKKKQKILIFIFFSLLIFLFFSYYYFIHSILYCNDWHKGLNNTYIENDL